MTVNDLKPRLLIAALATGAGLAVLLVADKTRWVWDVDSGCVIAATSHETGRHLVHDIDPVTDILTIRTLATEPAKGHAFRDILITDDADRIFEHSPPSALDYAIILESLHNRGYRRVILATGMTWDKQPGLEAEGLGERLALFERSVIPVPVTRAATPQAAPPALQRALIPLSQVRGNHRLLPLVNQVPLATHTDGGEHTLAGFSEIENTPGAPGQVPLLARWQGEGLIPSLDLLAIMVAHDTAPAELIVHCGRHVRLGVNGPVIALDDYGQTPAARAEIPAPPPALRAEELITPVYTTREAAANDPGAAAPGETIALIHASGEKTAATNALPPARISGLPALAQAHPVPENPRHIPRVPWWAAFIIIIDLALLGCWFGDLRRGSRHLSYILTVLFLFPLLLALLELTGHWLGLSAPLATILISWIIPVPLASPGRLKTVTIQHYDPAERRPVMRP